MGMPATKRPREKQREYGEFKVVHDLSTTEQDRANWLALAKNKRRQREGKREHGFDGFDGDGLPLWFYDLRPETEDEDEDGDDGTALLVWWH
ncbi:hypothetical protein CORC01_07274 [Colletotrichum orchidophilum]|uniref:Uncharacterized protein n=1 Tax=Colletotrichum orchidophilum TaxID=1209926 RepID=A0A1G4B895_9PEZI|nr:uncharacterized protein CORC01_07274 [Colletotrichum orchidophilum]OHE97492.1 hypothetical protein CORC01_07274 [Colletotrichum orchidophilum]